MTLRPADTLFVSAGQCAVCVRLLCGETQSVAEPSLWRPAGRKSLAGVPRICAKQLSMGSEHYYHADDDHDDD